MVQSDKYHKSRAAGVTSEFGLNTDREFSVPTCIRNMMSFITSRYRKSRGTSYYTTVSEIRKFKRVQQWLWGGHLSPLNRNTKWKQNRFISCHWFDWGNEKHGEKLGACVRWRNNLVRWHRINVILNLDV